MRTLHASLNLATAYWLDNEESYTAKIKKELSPQPESNSGSLIYTYG